ncbi:universal stress protein [bacterium]|nr:universal stress protein [bacterium]
MEASSTNTTSPFRRILWAIDASEPDTALENKTASVLRTLNQSLNASIEPVHVLRPGEQDSAGLLFRTAADNSRETEKRLSGFVEKHPIPGTVTPRVLAAETGSLAKAVGSLVRYAQSSNADLIVLSTRGRTGMARWFLGSFAELLLLESTVPVFIVNPKTEFLAGPRQIIFPTDFSDESKEAYRFTLRFARALSSRVLLVHQFELPYQPVAYPMAAPPVLPETVLNMERQQSALGAEWVALARKEGVEAEFEFLSVGRDLVSELRDLVARTSGTLVSLASRSGRVASMILGSVTRRLVREVPCPVLVLHAEESKAQTQPRSMTA